MPVIKSSKKQIWWDTIKIDIPNRKIEVTGLWCKGKPCSTKQVNYPTSFDDGHYIVLLDFDYQIYVTKNPPKVDWLAHLGWFNVVNGVIKDQEVITFEG